jgi:hypothetical protein
MLDWNFFGASCILAAYFSSLQDINSMNDTVVYSTWVSILLGTGFIVAVHAVYYLLRGYMSHVLDLFHNSLSFVLEVSLFMILCQNIGKRGPQRFTIPVEYAYVPLLVVVFVLSIRGKPPALAPTPSLLLQVCTGISFLLIVYLSGVPHMSYPGDSMDMLPLCLLLVLIYAVPERAVLDDIRYVIFSGICKSIIFSFAVSSMNSARRPDVSTFNRLYDFYIIRAVSQFDPQFDDVLLTPVQHLFSLHGLVGHFSKLVYLGTSCVWFGKLTRSQLWVYTSGAYETSRNELLLLGTVVGVLLGVMCVSKRHEYHTTHSVVMLEGLLVTAVACAFTVLLSCKPFTKNTTTSLFLCRVLNTYQK